MNTAVRLVLIVALVPLVAYAGLALAVGRDAVWMTLFGAGDRSAFDFATGTPTGKPNRFLVCPPGLCRAADAESPVFPVPADRLRAAAERLLEREGANRLPGVDADTIEAEVRTPLLRFPDLVTIRAVPLGPQRSALAVYSRSVYGHSDLGANRKRVERWLAELRGELS